MATIQEQFQIKSGLWWRTYDKYKMLTISPKKSDLSFWMWYRINRIISDGHLDRILFSFSSKKPLAALGSQIGTDSIFYH